MIKWSIQQKNKEYQNMSTEHHSPKIHLVKKMTKLKGEIQISTIKIGHFNTTFSIMKRETRQKISKDTEDLNNTINQPDITDISRILHPPQKTHILLRCRYNILQNKLYTKP